MLAAAVGSVWYTFVDAVSGFNQIRNTKRAREVLAIVARSGKYLPVGLTFGPVNGPDDFNFVVDRAYAPGKGRRLRYTKEWIAYVDDLTVRTGRVVDGKFYTDSVADQAVRDACAKGSSQAAPQSPESAMEALGFKPKPSPHDEARSDTNHPTRPETFRGLESAGFQGCGFKGFGVRVLRGLFAASLGARGATAAFVHNARNKVSGTVVPEPENTPPRPPSGAAPSGGAQQEADPPGSLSPSIELSTIVGAAGSATFAEASTRRRQMPASTNRLAARTWAPGAVAAGRPDPGALMTISSPGALRDAAKLQEYEDEIEPDSYRDDDHIAEVFTSRMREIAERKEAKEARKQAALAAIQASLLVGGWLSFRNLCYRCNGKRTAAGVLSRGIPDPTRDQQDRDESDSDDSAAIELAGGGPGGDGQAVPPLHQGQEGFRQEEAALAQGQQPQESS